MKPIGPGRSGIVLVVALAVLLWIPGAPAAAPVPAVASGPRAVRIMPLGASSTVGTGSPATAWYRGPLLEILTVQGVAVDFVGS